MPKPKPTKKAAPAKKQAEHPTLDSLIAECVNAAALARTLVNTMQEDEEDGTAKIYSSGTYGAQLVFEQAASRAEAFVVLLGKYRGTQSKRSFEMASSAEGHALELWALVHLASTGLTALVCGPKQPDAVTLAQLLDRTCHHIHKRAGEDLMPKRTAAQ